MDNIMTFFSGTDTDTLKEEGRDRNNFVSLIVNNAGTYTAAITRRVKSKQVKEAVSYEFFGEGEKQDTKEYVSNVDEIEYFYLKVEKENENYSFPDMAARLEEIKRTKEEKAKKSQVFTCQNEYKPITNNLISKEITKPKIIQSTLFDNIDDLPFDGYSNIPYGQVSFNKDTIKSLVLQLITGSIIVSNENKIDVIKWVKSMPVIYEKRFGKDDDGISNFMAWAETYVEYLVWNTTDDELEKAGLDSAEICAICAHNIIEELDKLPKNDYIEGYIDTLEKYLEV